VLDHEQAYMQELDDVSMIIKKRMIEKRREELDRKFMAELKSRYTIEINEEVQKTYNFKTLDSL
jgi:hypothetical protein